MILIHALGGFADQMRPMADALSRSNVATCYTLDMRGHGQSEGRRGHAVRHPRQLIDDLTAFVQEVRAANPNAKICLAGHSAGAGLVLGFARTAGDAMADSYLFLAPLPGLGRVARRHDVGGWASLGAMRLRALELANALGIERFNDATVVDVAMGGAADPECAPSWSYNTLLAFAPGRWTPETPAIAKDKPVLVLSGQHDDGPDPSPYVGAFSRAAPAAEIEQAGPIGRWDLLADEAALGRIADWLLQQSLADLKRLAPPSGWTAAETKTRRKAADKPMREAS